MFKLLSISILSFLIASCTPRQPQSDQDLKEDYPRSGNFKGLPEEIHVIGTIREICNGSCGIICLGGFVEVELERSIQNYDFKSIYLITACLSTRGRFNRKVNLIATLHTGRETECYYRNYCKPSNIEMPVFYKLTEMETSKIRC